MNVNTKEKYDTETKKTQITLILFLTHFVKIIQIRSFFWSVFSHSRTEYGEISVFSPNAGKYGPEEIPYLDTFHEVTILATQMLISSIKNFKLLSRLT